MENFDFISKQNILNVYYSVIPNNSSLYGVYPKERQDEIDSCKSLKVKKEKFYVWKLLEYGLKNTFDIDINKANLYKKSNGKWESESCFFSLTHSKNLVAVALSNKPVGVDIEVIKKPLVLGLEQKILNSLEFNSYNSLKEKEKLKNLIEKWTQKESIFKMQDNKVFNPKEIICENVSSQIIKEMGEEYFLSVASEYAKNKKIFRIDL